MKTINALFFVTANLFYQFGFAATHDQAIYEALNIEEIAIPAVRTKDVRMKAVGGLVCTKDDDIRHGVTFNCAFDSSAPNTEAVYKSLNVSEVGVPDLRMYISTQKSVGNFVCIRRAHFNPRINMTSVTCGFTQPKTQN